MRILIFANNRTEKYICLQKPAAALDIWLCICYKNTGSVFIRRYYFERHPLIDPKKATCPLFLPDTGRTTQKTGRKPVRNGQKARNGVTAKWNV